MAGIGNEEPPARVIGEHLSRVREERRGRRRVERELERRPVDASLRGELFDQRSDDRLEERVDALASVAAHQLPRRVDEHERRPGVCPERLPDFELGVVEDGVFEAVTQDRLADAVVVVFGGVFAGVDADDDQCVAELGFELLQVRDDVLAVDAAEGPEIEEHDLALEVRERQRLLHVEPGDAGGDCGRRLFPGPRFLRGRRS